MVNAKITDIVGQLEEEVQAKELDLQRLRQAIANLRAYGDTAGTELDVVLPKRDNQRYAGLKIAQVMNLWLRKINRGATEAEIIAEGKDGGCQKMLTARYPKRSLSLAVANSGGKFYKKDGLIYLYGGE